MIEGAGRGGIDGLAVGGGSGARPRSTPAPPRQPSAWWDGVSHVVTPPAREIVT